MIFFILIFCFLSPIGAANTNQSVQEPKTPVVSFSNVFDSSSEKFRFNYKKLSESNLYVFDVTLFFGNKVKLKGIVSFPEEMLRVKYKKKGFVFEKNIKWEDVKSIQILEWHPKPITDKKKVELVPYYFYPAKYKIVTKNKKIYYYKKNIPYLNKLILTNDDGSTTVYSVFVDYWKIKSKKSGFWINSRSTYFFYPYKNPNKKIFKRVLFK